MLKRTIDISTPLLWVIGLSLGLMFFASVVSTKIIYSLKKDLFSENPINNIFVDFRIIIPFTIVVDLVNMLNCVLAFIYTLFKRFSSSKAVFSDQIILSLSSFIVIRIILSLILMIFKFQLINQNDSEDLQKITNLTYEYQFVIIIIMPIFGYISTISNKQIFIERQELFNDCQDVKKVY